MRSRQFLPHLVVALMVGAAGPIFSQVSPSAIEGGNVSLSVGAGLSNFSPDLGSGRMMAGVLWVDITPPLPNLLHGLGIEVEGDDIAFDPTEKGVREEVASGGVTYAIRPFHGVRPYAKYLIGYGNADYPTSRGPYHQTRTVTTLGGGASIQATPAVSIRAEYEYQFWPDFFITAKHLQDAPAMHPNGITVGASYRFNSLRLPW